ncbi:hypothetical protein [Arcobacter defluvii]|uniref:Uncharacterized protein n=1 Tax=Arcobacter defluvii TaxID=873191 RepID=A0AAE7E6G0_9BACT|nr:hypothetical protein [Arcobacter defluvii]QKF77347.1 hypothetical protein ADFLV_1315 [Arcobacter defluvii]RXI29604.1 hypothetical protein CP964_13230 [Arcobacter defluvii]
MDKNIIVKDKNADSISIEKIKNILENQKSNDKDLYKKIGYNSKQIFEKSLNKFLKYKSLKEWIEKGYYDFTNNATEFFVKLSKELGFKDSEINNIIFKITEYIEEKNKLSSSYIFINTNFKREGESILTLAMLENKRRISLYKNEKFLFKPINEILELVSSIVVEHYEINNGKCFIWGRYC